MNRYVVTFPGFIALVLAAIILHVAQVSPVRAAGATSIAVFDFELYDTSLEGAKNGLRPDETKRLKMISDQLRDILRKSDIYKVVDTAPKADEIKDVGEFRGCEGCGVKIAKELGADLSLNGVVQKVSNLILNINIYIRSTGTGKLVDVMSTDIRGNTDESWSHGIKWLAKHRLLNSQRPGMPHEASAKQQ